MAISPLNQKKKKLSSWAIRQSHLKADSVFFSWIIRSSVSMNRLKIWQIFFSYFIHEFSKLEIKHLLVTGSFTLN